MVPPLKKCRAIQSSACCACDRSTPQLAAVRKKLHMRDALSSSALDGDITLQASKALRYLTQAIFSDAMLARVRELQFQHNSHGDQSTHDPQVYLLVHQRGGLTMKWYGSAFSTKTWTNSRPPGFSHVATLLISSWNIDMSMRSVNAVDGQVSTVLVGACILNGLQLADVMR